MKPVNPIKIKENMSVKELVGSMKDAGFGAGKIAEASEIMKKMFDDEKCTVFFGLAGAMVPAGMKEVIMDILDHVNVLAVTGANLTHDLVEALGEKHYLTSENVDDEELHKLGYDRMYNVLMKNDVYAKIENFLEENLAEFQKCTNIREFLTKMGELCPGNGILKKCYEKNIPIFCPALADSGIGLMIWGKIAAGKKMDINAFDDMKEIINIS